VLHFTTPVAAAVGASICISLATVGDALKRINNNAYLIDIPPLKYTVSNTFDVLDISPYHGDKEKLESRTNISQK
jgi:hypothetical protein